MAKASRGLSATSLAAALGLVIGAGLWLTKSGRDPEPVRDAASDSAGSAHAVADVAPATSPTPAASPIPDPPVAPAAAAPPRAALPEGAFPGEDRDDRDARVRALHPTWEEIAAEGIPAPPKEFTGTPLRWRLDFPMEPGRFEALIRGLRFLTEVERTDLLQKVRRAKDPAHGRILLEEIPRIPHNPVTLFDVATALGESAEAVRRKGADEAGRLGLPSVRELTAASLALYARKVREYGHVMNEAEWGGIHSKFERLAKIDPGLFADDASRVPVETVRNGVEACLLHILDDSQGGYLGGVNAFRLAGTVADEGTHDLLARLLDSWDEARRRFPHGSDTSSLSERTAFLVAWRALILPPCPSHALKGASALAARFQAEGGAANPKNPFLNQVSELSRGRGVPEEIRRLLCEALGEPFIETDASRRPAVPPPPPDPRPEEVRGTATYGEPGEEE